MANRYLRASGNWNGPVWAATSGGTAGSAATPTASDDVYIAANYTVTLTADAFCNKLTHSNGTITAGSYDMYIGMENSASVGFYSTGSTARTINMGSGKWHVHLSFDSLSLTGSGLTLNPQSSTLILYNDYSSSFGTLSKTFNDVVVEMGVGVTGAPGSTELSITGSPTFRSLIIQSKNSEAHTVIFDGGGSGMDVDKLIMVGSSSANKLTLTTTSGDHYVGVSSAGSSYGQFVAMNNVWSAFGSNYIGSNSTDSTSSWLLQDPPKISTLVDSLTALPGANTKWVADGTVTQLNTGVGNGGYGLSGGVEINSTDTYDLYDSSIVFELTDANKIPVISHEMVGGGLIYGGIDIDGMSFQFEYYDGNGTLSVSDPAPVPSFVRLSADFVGDLAAHYTTDGITWVDMDFHGWLTSDEVLSIRSMRVNISSGSIGSVGMLPNQPPTIALGAPANNANLGTITPTFTFTGTDPEGNKLTYQIQIDTVNTFDSQGGV